MRKCFGHEQQAFGEKQAEKLTRDFQRVYARLNAFARAGTNGFVGEFERTKGGFRRWPKRFLQ